MKNFKYLIICAMLAGMSMSVTAVTNMPKRFQAEKTLQPNRYEFSKENSMKTLKDAYEKSVKAADAKSSAIWRHTKEAGYSFDGEDWSLEGAFENITYDARGNKLSELETDVEGFQYTNLYGWDDNNQQISEYIESIDILNGNTPISKGNYTWDPVVHDFCTYKQNWDYSSGSWVENYANYRRTVTRNDAGNVTGLSLEMYYINAYEEIEKTEITYNETTGQADCYTLSRLEASQVSGNLVWKVKQEAKDIVWERTDGQLVREWQSFMMGNNRFKEAAIYYNGELDGYQYVTYTEGKVDYESKETDIDGNVYVTTTYTTTDDNGSFTVVYDYMGTVTTSTYNYNDNGDLVLFEQYEDDGENVTLLAAERYTYKYDTATGVIVESLTEVKYSDDGDYEPLIKIVYEDFIDVTKQSDIESVNTEDNAPAEYYNLQGVRVSRPENGLFIRKQGSRTTKIVL